MSGDGTDLAWAAYSLGKMLAMEIYGVGDEPAAETLDRYMGTLREIAEGQLTLFSGSAEMIAPYPDMDSELRESVHRHTNEVMRREREAAKLILGIYESLG